MKPKNKAKNLLSKSYQSYYWMGFLMADGHFSNNNRMTISLSMKDEYHLKELAKFIDKNAHITYYKIKNDMQYCRYSVMDKNTFEILRKTFDINHHKTENPPGLKFYKKMENDLFLSFLIGLIDGDGRITYQSGRNDCFIEIKLHKSWLNFLMMIQKRLQIILDIKIPKAKINKDGYALITFSNLKICRFLKQSVIKLKLNVLERKWNKINENRVSRYETSLNNAILITPLFNQGLSGNEIREKTGLKLSTIYSIKKRIKIISA